MRKGIMDNLTVGNYYIEDGQNHECCSLTDLIFRNVDYSQYNQTISFYRTDFSRSSFYNCKFNRNQFGRADFIDVYITNTEFNCVDFGSCLLKNALFENVKFVSNNYHGIAIQYSCFKNCIFRDEDFITNMYQSEFVECTFVNCTFHKSSLDLNTFTNCIFTEVDMSECIAENLRFDTCSLHDIYLGANLWTTYLYRNTDLYGFGFKYRGQFVDIWNGSAEEFIKALISRRLYFEYLNVLIISDLSYSYNLLEEFKRIMPEVLVLPAQQRRSTLVKILDMLLFYKNYLKIPFDKYLSLINYFDEVDWKNISFDEQLIYESKLFKIKKTIEQLDYDLNYIKSIPLHSMCVSRFHLNCDNENEALAYLEGSFNMANHFYNDLYEKPLFTVITKEKGSIVLTIASAAALALLVSYIAKKVMHNLFSIQIENSIKKRFIKEIFDTNTDLTAVKRSCALAQKYSFLPTEDDSKKINELSSELTKGEILDIILNFLF